MLSNIMDLKFDWWFLPLFSLCIVIGIIFLLTLYLLVFGFIFLFTYLISHLFLDLIETLCKWKPLLKKRNKRYLVISLAILFSVAILTGEKFLEIRQGLWDFLLLLPAALSELMKAILSIRV